MYLNPTLGLFSFSNFSLYSMHNINNFLFSILFMDHENTMTSSDKIRIDKWLYAVRIFKTRSMATDACNAGKVKMKDDRVKPSKLVTVGDILTVQKPFYKQICKVTGLVEKRISAKLIPDFMEDLTPPIDLEIQKTAFKYPVAKRNRGEGRPTKKDRRQIEKFKEVFNDHN